MNIRDSFELLNLDMEILTNKKQQTNYKIKYVSEYTKLWTIISAERQEVSEISFIDCMCNVSDGELQSGITAN